MKSTRIKVFSPLRYPGSKQKILKYLEEILSCNSLNPEILVEPFVGGGSVFLYFLNYGLINKAIISDKDILIYSFWKTVFEAPNSLINFLLETKVNLETYYHYKQIMANTGGYETLDLAKACIFLNRTSFSGILTQSARAKLKV